MSVDKLVTDILGERPNVKDRALRELIDARMKKGGAVVMKRGGRAKGETLASMDTGKVETRKAPGAEKAERILSGAVELLPGVAAGKSAIEGEYQKALIEAGLDVAGGPLAKGLGAAIPAVAGIFIGSNARLWDKAAAKEFKKLEKAGVSNEEAFKQTNTFRSPDGELRQEISDRPARLKGEKLRDISGALQLNVDAPQKAKLEKMYADIFDQMKSSGTDAPLSQLIYHPELFKAYPELESLRGRYNIIPSMPETGYYNLGSPTTPPRLGAEGPTPESARSSMLHEIQHAIQHLEGFGMGGNPEMGMTMLPRSMDAVDYLNQLRKSKMNLLDEQARLAKEFKESGAQYTLDNPLVQRSIELPNKIDDVDQAIEGIVQGYFYPMYKRMAGEAESRAIQARRQMSPQELRDVFPLSSYDVPVDQLIVKRVPPYANGGAVMMAGGGEAQAAPYGLRETGMPKGRGYFGELPTADGVMTELSASDDAGDFPLIVPTLTAAELKHLQSGGEPTAEIYAKAKAWAESRKGQGRDPFATSQDLRMPVPEYAKGGEVHAKGGGSDLKSLKRLTPFYGAKSAPVDTEEEEAKRRLRELEGRVLERDYIEPQKDDLEGMVRRGLRSGLGKVMSPEGSKRSADILTDVASFVAPPMLGYESGQALGRAYEAGRSGNYGEAALEGGIGALGLLPAAPGIVQGAKAVGRGVKKAAPAVREAASGALESAMESGAILDPRMQAIAYHGSPHKFEKFDPSKIGTGEGAQSYGHGLYFAESPKVAKGYQETLSKNLDPIVGGEPFDRMNPRHQAAAALHYNFNNPEATLITLNGMAKNASKEMKSIFLQAKKLIDVGDIRATLPKVLDQSGFLYKVDIPDESIARMLDWDKPLGEQPENVLSALKRRITEPKAIDGMDMGGNARLRDNRQRQVDPNQSQPWVLEAQSANGTSRFGLSQKDVDRLIGGQDVGQLTGSQIYQRLSAEYGGFPQVSEKLKTLGIPGIKYFDAGSRGAGEGTRNFVVFPGEEESVKILERKKKGGAVQKYGKGGVVKSLIKKASEALGEHEGKSLLVTQSDRTKVGGKFLGGPGFSSLQLTDPFYKEAEAVWGVGKKGAATKMINAAQRLPEGKAIWSTMIGSPEQHKSNQQVFDELLRKFRSSAKEGNLDPDLRERINAKLASAVDGEGKPLFPEGVDIMSPKFRQIANTFDRRAIAADAMGGVQLGGKKGQIIDYSKIIESTTDPLLIDQPTHAIGPRLFQLQGDVIERPDLHPAYPFILTGEDLATEFVPVPRDIMLRDFVEGIRQSKGREPGFMDLTRNTPSQFLSEEFLTGLQKSGFKKGGPVKKGALPTKRA